MPLKTTIKQKILLIFLGLSFAVIFLEISLRIAGGIVLYLQERHNHVSFNPNEFRILCLGESTTALGGDDSYPSQLEQMLNAQKLSKNFTVINEGIVSTTTEYILAHVDHNLDRYKPQLVIVMMGINDKVFMHGPYKTLWWENIKLYLKDLRVYKLAYLLHEHISHRIKEISTPADKADLSHPDVGNYQHMENFLKLVIANSIQRYHEHLSRHEDQSAHQSIIQASLACVELAQRYRLKKAFHEAQDILEQATILDPKDTAVYQEWGELYLAQDQYAKAVESFQAALALDPKNNDVLPRLAHALYQEHNEEAFLVYADYLQSKPHDYWGHIELARWLKKYNHYELAQEYLNQAIEVAPYFDQAYLDMGKILDDRNQYEQEEAFYIHEISLHPKFSRLYQALGQFYQKQGKKDQAKIYFQQGDQQEVANYYPTTFVNDALILNKILSRNIKVIVMQYPLRDIDPLKDYLGQRNGITFVENKQNFKQALAEKGFNYYFKDNFAYDFGHCTREGNSLIAHNLTDVILKEILNINQGA